MLRGIVAVELSLEAEVLDMLWHTGMGNVSIDMARVGVR